MNPTQAEQLEKERSVEQRVRDLIAQMTIAEKVGQMYQAAAEDQGISADFAERLRAGRVGSVINVVDVATVNEMQRIATEQSRLGIPLMIGRDVVHGFRTVMPIPLGQAASWNRDAVLEGARIAALEAAASGINWTFAPMIDVSRDARWGRIAESFGEDPYLTSELGIAMIRGFQGDDLAEHGTIAACAKHFAGYGASEAGRDYSTTNIPENELRNIYLKPFKAASEAGTASIMASFSDLDGVPATANEFLMRQVLRDEWAFEGFVVSDYDSVSELTVHGVAENDREAAYQAVSAGVDMEMVSSCYVEHLEGLIGEGRIDVVLVDKMVANILRVKLRLGLFENPYTDSANFPPTASSAALQAAKKLASQSAVLLKNDNATLPLSTERLNSIAVIGPLADDPYEQLGTWIFDGDPSLSVSGLQGIREQVGDSIEVTFVKALDTSRSRDSTGFDDAVKAANEADATILFLGEESILSGEAHSRADIGLPGAQTELVCRIRATGKPVVAVILSGRPLTLTDIVDEVDAILFAWHPGSMGGAAIADLLFGVESPSGKLPATFPRMVGQIPIYYNHKNSGKPPSNNEIVLMDDIEVRAKQTSLGMSAFHLDAGFEPLFPFGFGLSYAKFEYENIQASDSDIAVGEQLTITADLANRGSVAAEEVVQLYVRDLVGSITRPVRELKAFKRVRVEPGQTVSVSFDLHTDELAFFGRNNQLIIEPGEFHAWIGGNSATELRCEFRVTESR